MSQTLKLAALGALATAALFALASTAGARPTQIDDYCSPSGDICQEITLSKHGGRIKFGLYSNTPAVMASTHCASRARARRSARTSRSNSRPPTR